MSYDYNQVILMGRCGGEPDIFRIEGKTPFAKVQVATNKQWKKDNTLHKRTDWHTVIFNRKLAEVVEKYLHKGDRVLIKGELITQKWQDKDGNARTTVSIQAQEVRFLTPKQMASAKTSADNTVEENADAMESLEMDDIPF